MHPLKVLITGATGGLGSELTVQLARTGADLLLVDKNSRDLDKLSDRVCAEGFREPGVCSLDLSRSGTDQYEKIAEIIRSEFGGLDVFIHSAAEFDGLQPLDQMEPAYLSKCMQVNVLAAWQMVMSCLPLLKESGKGRVIFVQEDEKVFRSAYWGAYGVSKAALESLGQIMEEEFQGTGVKVLNCYPGPIRTALRARAYLAEDPNSIQLPADAASKIIAKIIGGYAD